ncbi:MAG: helix-turn-helix domain-containing protein [Candidatus Micrarchaeia archaeon]
MECEVCGKETSVVYVVEVERAILNVCAECAKGKKIVEKIDLSKQKEEKKAIKRNEEEEKEVVEHYGGLIKKARERFGFSVGVLAERINEKESTMLRIEEEKMLPNDKIIKKLEKELGIKLLEPKKKTQNVHIKPNEPFTLWDAAEKKEKR